MEVANPYRRLFSAPGTVAFVMAGFVGRTAHLMTVLSVIFLVSAVTGSYGLAGAVSAVYALTYSVVSPMLSHLVDRKRQGRVLVPTTIANVASRAGFLAAMWLDAPAWSLLVLSSLSGGTMPPIGSLVRARWNHLFRGSALVHTAWAFESVVDEIIFVTGPIAVAMLVTYVDPAAGLIMALVFSAIGPGGLAAQRRTEPPALPPDRRASGTALSAPGLPLLILTFITLSVAASTIELAIVAFSQEHGAKANGGWMLAVLALGSAMSGLWYGAREWASPPERRLVVTLTLLTGGTLLFVAGSSIRFLFVAAFMLGLTMAPTLIAGFSIVSRSVPQRQLTEGLTWLTTSMGIGISLGAAVAGRVVDRWGTRAAFIMATCCAAVAILTGLATAGRLRRAAGQRLTATPAG